MKKISIIFIALMFTSKLFATAGFVTGSTQLEAPAFEMIRSELLNNIDSQAFLEYSASKISDEAVEFEVTTIERNFMEGVDQNGDTIKIFKEAVKPLTSAAKINGKIRIFPKQQ